MSTKIEWATDTWNAITGCPGPKVSPGCAHCYAERMATTRLRGRMGYDATEPFKVTYHYDKYEQFLGARKHKRIFVNSMGDLFHPDVDQHELDCVFAAMMACEITTGPSHDFMVLTKRPDIMSEYFSPGPEAMLRRWGNAGNGWLHVGDGDETFSEYAEGQTIPQPEHEMFPNLRHEFLWPLPNFWPGVTVCNYDELWKLAVLREIPAPLHFVSFEPLLGDLGTVNLDGIGWVICGGETGPRARPMHPDWVRSLRDQCQVSGVPFFFKSWGEWLPCSQCADNDPYIERLSRSTPYTEIGDDGITDTDTGEGVICRNGVSTEQIFRIGKHRSGRLLDGREWNEVPEVRDERI